MTPYRNLSGHSNIQSYEIGDDRIIVRFASGAYRTYTYTYASAGSHHIENMKACAIQGRGLNAYIKRNRVRYSGKS